MPDKQTKRQHRALLSHEYGQNPETYENVHKEESKKNGKRHLSEIRTNTEYSKNEERSNINKSTEDTVGPSYLEQIA